MAKRFEIKRSIIDWALHRSSLNMERALKSAPSLKNVEQEKTTVDLSYGELSALSSLTRVPLGYFFLPQPPAEKLPIPDFRTVGDEAVREMSPDLIETVLSMHSRQQWYREYAVGEGYKPVTFVGTADTKNDPAKLAFRIREELALPPSWACHIYSYGEAVSHIRDKLQEAGVLVVINGVVGNNANRKLNPREFRGFVLSDTVAPLLFVNGADSKSAQMFTLFHELVHLWTGKAGIVDIDENYTSTNESEIFCNRVAALILVPSRELTETWLKEPTFDDLLARPAKKFKVSPIVIARRLRELELITKDQFIGFYDIYTSRGFVASKDSASEGGNFYNNQNNRIGKKFMRAVARATLEGKLSYTHAFRLTGLSSATFDKYVQAIGL